MGKNSKTLFLQLYSEISTKISSIDRELLECERKNLEHSHGATPKQNTKQSLKQKRLHKMRKARKAKIKRLRERISDICK